MFVVTIDIDKCEACGECVDVCAVGALSMEEEDGKMYAVYSGDPDDCLGCLSCQEVCGEDAITVEEY